MKRILSLTIVLALLLGTVTTVFAVDLDLINQVDSTKNFSWNEFVRVSANLRYVGENMKDYLIEYKGEFYDAEEVDAGFEAGAKNFDEAIKDLEPVEEPSEGLEVVDISAINDRTVVVGTDLAGLELEETVTATLNDAKEATEEEEAVEATEVTLDVVWAENDEYDADTAADYTFTYELKAQEDEELEFVIPEEFATGSITVTVLTEEDAALADAIAAAEAAIADLPEAVTLDQEDEVAAVEAARELVDAALALDEDAEIEGIEALEALEEALEDEQKIVDAVNEATTQLTLHAALKDFEGYNAELIQDYVTEKTGKTYTSVKDIQENLVDKVNKAAEDKTEAEAFRAELLAEAKKSDVALYNYLKGLTDTTELDNVGAYKTEMFNYDGEVTFKIALEDDNSIKEAADVVEIINYVNAEIAVDELFDAGALAADVEQKDIDAAQVLVNKVTGSIDPEADDYVEAKKALQDGVDAAQVLLDVRVATEAVEALFADYDTKNELAEGVGQEEIDAAKALVDALEDGSIKTGLLTNIEAAQALEPLTAALAVINGTEGYNIAEDLVITVDEDTTITIPGDEYTFELATFENSGTTVNARHAMTVFMVENADLLGIDVEGDFAELLYGPGKSRKVAVAYDLVNNRQFEEDEEYTLERFQEVFNEIVATRTATEASTALFNEEVATGGLKDLTYLQMMLDQFKSVSYTNHSGKSIEDEKIPEIEDAIADYDALSGKEVLVDGNGALVTSGDGTKFKDAQEYVRKKLTGAGQNSDAISKLTDLIDAVEANLQALAAVDSVTAVIETEITEGKVVAGTELTVKLTAKNGDEAQKKYNETLRRIDVTHGETVIPLRNVEFVEGVATVTITLNKTANSNVLDFGTIAGQGNIKTVSFAVVAGDLAVIKGEATAEEVTLKPEDKLGNAVDISGATVVDVFVVDSDKVIALDEVSLDSGSEKITVALEEGNYTISLELKIGDEVKTFEIDVEVEAPEEA